MEDYHMAAINLKKLNPKELQELITNAQQQLDMGYVQRVMETKRRCQELCEAEGLSLSEVFFEGKNKGKVAPKYRDPKTGKTWSGRGKEPGWLNGNKEAYAI
jgi:DNA-binding protein H-NS